MTTVELKNKPLVEALLEIRWRVGQHPVDPHYQLLIGRLYDQLAGEYPSHKALDAAQLPAVVAADAGIVQHQLRAPEDWPLIQLGPGVMTVNVTEKYSWPDFGPRCRRAVEGLFAVHPNAGEIRVTSAMLRFIDAIDFDFAKANVIPFLDAKLKVKLGLASALFDGTGVEGRPSEMDVNLTFPLEKPKGRVRLRFASGQRKGRPALIWETIVLSREGDAPRKPSEFGEWLEAAHDLTHDWFFKMIEGDLLKEFQGE